jgi:hypothetical protein
LFSLAEKTGWTIDYMLWEIPLSAMAQASHALMWMAGIKCRRRTSINSEEMLELEKMIGL